MKLVWLFIFTIFAPALFSQNFREGVVSARLMERLRDFPGEFHSFYVALEDKVDAVALNQSLRAEKAPLAERSRRVNTLLRSKADATQGPVIQFLETSREVEEGSVRPYWITNLVYAKGSASVIAELSWRGDIAFLDLNAPLAKSAHEEVLTLHAGASPNGKEPGLVAIKAPALWALGYSGYGRVCFTNDTGVDPGHPALSAQYQGYLTEPGISWYEFDGPDTYPYDCDNHGTHVTGIIMGMDRQNRDTIGVAFNARWTGASTIGCGNEYFNQDNIGALQWALDPDGNPNTTEDMPDVINNSWYDPTVDEECTSIYVQVLNALDAASIAVVFSAGNEGPGDQTISPPHNINTDLVNSFTVGALNGNSIWYPIAEFSSRGPSICGGEGQLLTKPEVSAPGVSVRSCVPKAGYASFNGTSMSAPHVSGAILLLKEAFPYLPGHELKLALYNTCTDLGDPGEDNDYGMGIINVEAAYNYLVAQGNIPAPPVSNNTDALVVRLESNANNCAETAMGRVLVENDGLTTIQEMELSVTLDGIATPFGWQGSIAPGEIATIQLPAIPSPVGEKDLAVEILTVNGAPDDRLLNNRFVLPIVVEDRLPLVAGVDLGQGMNACEGSVVALRAQYDGPGTAAFRWYDAPSGGNLLGEGPVLLAGPLPGDTVFFAQATYTDRVGLEGREGGSWELGPYPEQEGLIFDAYNPFRIKSALIYTEQEGPRIFKLLDSEGETLRTKTMVVQGVGATRVSLNMAVPKGHDLRLVFDYGIPLIYNTSGPNFPYEMTDIMKIKSSTGPNGLQRWFYFYDWEIEYEEICGRTAVDVAGLGQGQPPVADFSVSADTLILEEGSAVVGFTDLSTGASSWYWNFGDGTTGTEQNPTHVYTAPGTYTVSLSVDGGDGCAASAARNILVEEEASGIFEPVRGGDLRLFPNPAGDWITVAWEGEASCLMVFDATGRQLILQRVEGTQAELDLNGLSNGLYFVFVDGRSARFQVMH